MSSILQKTAYGTLSQSTCKFVSPTDYFS